MTATKENIPQQAKTIEAPDDAPRKKEETNPVKADNAAIIAAKAIRSPKLLESNEAVAAGVTKSALVRITPTAWIPVTTVNVNKARSSKRMAPDGMPITRAWV